MMYGLREEILNDICTIFSNYSSIEKVILYGSRAKGNYRSGSDIDLTCVGSELSLSLLNKIELDIDDLLLPYTFDISIRSQISNSDLLEHIERVGKIFYERK